MGRRFPVTEQKGSSCSTAHQSHSRPCSLVSKDQPEGLYSAQIHACKSHHHGRKQCRRPQALSWAGDAVIKRHTPEGTLTAQPSGKQPPLLPGA